ncbi:MAG: response regulator [Nitrospirota bacterium]|jgi:CheY-like chemotaxis protein
MEKVAKHSTQVRLPEGGSDARTTILLATCLSHRLNNVLSGIVGSLDLGDGDEAAAGAEMLSNLVRQSTREAEAIARNLATILQDQRLGTERVAVERFLPEVFHLLEMGTGDGYRFEVQSPAEPLEVAVESCLLMRLCLLLGQAAMSYAQDGEAVQAWARRIKDSGGPMVRLSFGPIYLRDGVGDDGVNMATAFLQEAVTVARCLGTRPEAGEDGTVSFELPLATPTSPAAVSGDGTDLSGLRVLFVDDENVVRQVVRSALRRLQADGTVVDSPLEALRRLEEDPAGYDILVTDFIMPEMNGQQLFQRAKELVPKLPVLITSGYAEDAKIRECLRDGARGFLPKPFTLTVFAAALRGAIAGAEG